MSNPGIYFTQFPPPYGTKSNPNAAPTSNAQGKQQQQSQQQPQSDEQSIDSFHERFE